MNVLIDGKNCEVFETPICRYVIYSAFEKCDKVSVEVLPDEKIGNAKIKPLSAKINCRNENGKVLFDVEIPSKISLEFTDNEELPLFLFLYEPEKKPEGKNIRVYAKGEHRGDKIELHSGDTLYLEEGAILHIPVEAIYCKNVTVCGRGILDVDECGSSVRKPFHFIESKNITMRDITITGSYGWCCVFTGCENITADGINIIGWRCTGDGVDIVGSQNVTVQNCFIRTADDCVAIKAAGYSHASGMQDVYNVTVKHCVLWNGHPGNGMEIGFETRCDEISDIVFEDIDLIHCEHEGWQSGGSITIHNGDRAKIHDIIYRDIRVEDSYDKLFDFKVLRSNYSKDDERGSVENILVERVAIVSGAFPPSILSGYTPDDHLVRNVRFVGITAYGKPILSPLDCRMICERTKDITFEKGK